MDNGAHNRSTIKGFYAAGGEDSTRSEEFVIDAGEPAILLGTDTGPNPSEYLLHALAGVPYHVDRLYARRTQSRADVRGVDHHRG